ncbi:MAG: AP2 domain-containing protein [Methylobacillus sp.]|jgi:hypothetical protein|nr:AP2 domain-containing protein [Methylobacillus sp.]
MRRHRNITRVDDDASRTHAWRVTVQRKGKISVSSFSDGVYGGKMKALSAAIEHRDLLISEHSLREHRIWLCSRLRKNNTSGIPGVGRYEVLANRNTGRYYAFWLACWADEKGRNRNRKFMISRFGERRAKSLAIAERKSQLLRVSALKEQM